MKYKTRMHIEDMEQLYDSIDDEFEKFLKSALEHKPKDYDDLKENEMRLMYISFSYGFLIAQEKLMDEFKEIH